MGLSVLRIDCREGQALGKENTNGKVDPLEVVMPEGRKGIGHDMERKRKLKELYEDSLKQQDTYREDIRSEKEEARLKARLLEAQQVCQNLDAQAAEKKGLEVPPNVIWRGLDRERDTELKVRQFKRRMMYEASGTPLGEVSDDEFDKVVQPLEDDDMELDEFEALPLEKQMEEVLSYMREKYFYCFWCGCAYDSAEDLADNCPGLTEEDH